MNRTCPIDSKVSLDDVMAGGHGLRMSRFSYHLYCQRIDQASNMARYFALSIKPTLFGEAEVMRAWGRIGYRGGEKSEIFATEAEALAHFLYLVRRKRRLGYKPADPLSMSCSWHGKLLPYPTTPTWT